MQILQNFLRNFKVVVNGTMSNEDVWSDVSQRTVQEVPRLQMGCVPKIFFINQTFGTQNLISHRNNVINRG